MNTCSSFSCVLEYGNIMQFLLLDSLYYISVFAFLLNFSAACNVCHLKCIGFIITPTSHCLNIHQQVFALMYLKTYGILMCLVNFECNKIPRAGHVSSCSYCPLTFILTMITYIKRNEYGDVTTNITKETSTVVM